MTLPSTGVVLVTGATGKQGGAVARALLARDRPVRGLTRSLASAEVARLQSLGVDMVEGHFDQPDTLARAMDGVSAVFAMGTPFEAGVPAEVRQGLRLIEAARKAGVSFFLYTSVASADRNTGIPHFESKFQIEQALRQSPLAFAILGPAFFLENLLAINMLAQLRQGRLSLPLPADRRLQVVAVRDLGRFAALVFSQPDDFVGQRIDIASDEVNGVHMAQAIGRRLGRAIDFVPRPVEQVRAWNPDYAQMFEWLDRIGYAADIPGLQSHWPEIGWQRFDQWAAAQPWVDLLGAEAA